MKNRKLWVSILAGLLVATMLLGLIIGALPRKADAASSSELKDQLDGLIAQKDAITSRIEALEAQQDENRKDIEGIVKQKDIIDQQVALLYAQISNVNDQIATYSLLIADKQVELEEAQTKLDELTRKNKERLRAMEEEGELSYWSVIFNANSFSDLLDRVSMVKEIAAADQRRLQEMNEMAEAVVKAQKDLADKKAELEQTRADLEQSQKTLDAKNAEADQLLADLVTVSEDMEALHSEWEEDEDEFLLQIIQKDQEYNNQLNIELESSRKASIQASIQASIAESRHQAALEESRRQEALEESRRQEAIQASKNQQSSKPTTSGGNGGNSSGRWLKPTHYSYISSPFGYRWHPVTGEWKMHNGVDMPAPKGTPIYASRSGYVTLATWHSTAGNYVIVNHQDGYSSVYMHMTHYIVGVGDYVEAGEIIGYVGSTGRSTGPHLHFGISYNGKYVNPMDYL